MARKKLTYACQACGTHYARWQGRCDACGEWNQVLEQSTTISQPVAGLRGQKARSATSGEPTAFFALEGDAQKLERLSSGIAEFDLVAGGGLVPGSAVLLGGDPGIGKSTLLLQVTAALAGKSGGRLVYISGEEGLDQIRLRARRLGLQQAQMELATSCNLESITAALDQPDAPDLVVIDSIQTLYHPDIESAPGTVLQVRASAQILIELAKRRSLVLLLVGHVNKEGQIAGPKVLEHMVDCVLHFEGERGQAYRILRTLKNRYGNTEEIGVFEMGEAGLQPVENPSSLFLAERRKGLAGSVVFAGVEGTRPLLVEVQALVAPSTLAMPRRTAVGWDSGRLAMILAVLETRLSARFSQREVYLNVAGGFRINEPAADLAVALALLSAMANKPVPDQAVFFGEVGLLGEVRGVGRVGLRLKEAGKLGFRQAYGPGKAEDNSPAGTKTGNISLNPVAHVSELKALLV